MQHAGNGAVVNRLVSIHRFGIVLLDQAVNVGELPQAVTNIGVAARRCRRVDLLAEDHAEESAGDKNENRKIECATRTTGHAFSFLRFGRREGPATASERSIARPETGPRRP